MREWGTILVRTTVDGVPGVLPIEIASHDAGHSDDLDYVILCDRVRRSIADWLRPGLGRRRADDISASLAARPVPVELVASEGGEVRVFRPGRVPGGDILEHLCAQRGLGAAGFVGGT